MATATGKFAVVVVYIFFQPMLEVPRVQAKTVRNGKFTNEKANLKERVRLWRSREGTLNIQKLHDYLSAVHGWRYVLEDDRFVSGMCSKICGGMWPNINFHKILTPVVAHTMCQKVSSLGL